MKITKRQIKSILETRFISAPEKAKRENIFNSYDAFVKEHGHITSASSSVMATFIINHFKEMKGSPGYLAKIMGEKYGVDQDDINRDAERQKREGLAEMKITKSQLRRIISEVMSDDPEIPDVLGIMGSGKFQPREESDKRDALMTALQKEWGLKHVKTTEEFDGTPGGIWLAGDEGETAPPWVQDGQDLAIFDYYNNQEPYIFGIHPEFEAFVIDKFGFAPEWNDPGTLMLWSLD